MRVISLKIKNFRNIESAVLNPAETMNVICGENAQGKTNTLEALWLFTGAKSFRGAKDKEFVSFGKEKAVLDICFESEKTEKTARLEIAEKRTAYLNENKLKAPSLLSESYNAIVFSPQDLRIVTDGPSVRRRFLDLAIGQLSPSYIENLRDYTRAVMQRNTAVKDYRLNSSLSSLLDVFEEKIAETGEIITAHRKKYINMLNSFTSEIYNGISDGKEIFTSEYLSSLNEGDMRKALFNSRKEDMFSGVTSIGPHRDDIEFKINSHNARNYASQGQKRSIALTLKLAEAGIIKNIVGESPLCFMDDVMSELDPKRQSFVLNKIKDMQTFLTCCDPENYKSLKAGRVFNIKNGRVE